MNEIPTVLGIPATIEVYGVPILASLSAEEDSTIYVAEGHGLDRQRLKAIVSRIIKVVGYFPDFKLWNSWDEVFIEASGTVTWLPDGNYSIAIDTVGSPVTVVEF